MAWIFKSPDILWQSSSKILSFQTSIHFLLVSKFYTTWLSFSHRNPKYQDILFSFSVSHNTFYGKSKFTWFNQFFYSKKFSNDSVLKVVLFFSDLYIKHIAYYLCLEDYILSLLLYSFLIGKEIFFISSTVDFNWALLSFIKIFNTSWYFQNGCNF